MSPGPPLDTMDQSDQEDTPRELVFGKMEKLIREMQHPEHGVPVRSQKLFLTSIPCAFLGYDLVDWLMEHLGIEDSAEAFHLANLLCQHGYFFPVNDTKPLVLKDDSALYRFQSPYFWPSHHQPDNTEYAIYLVKRTGKSRQKHSLEDYEQESLDRLKKLLCHKWEFICMQAEEQASLMKDRKKTDKVILESQEKAYWHVHRPPPGVTSCFERSPLANRRTRKKKSKDELKIDIEILKRCLARPRCKVSQSVETLLHRLQEYAAFDPFISGVQPSNPWISDDITLWTLNKMLTDTFTEKRLKLWALSLGELLADPSGVKEFEQYLRKEYSHENIHFWIAVQDLKRTSQKNVAKKVLDIYAEFLAPGSPQQVNLDGRTVEATHESMKKPSRYTFDAAQKHVYSLMKNDTYPRFVRSGHYQTLLLNALQPTQKKRFCNFGSTKKKGSIVSTNKQSGQLSGSAVDLSPTVKEKTKWPFCGRHSHSTSDLHDLEAPVARMASSTLSSPSGSRERVNERGTTLQVPRWNHRGSDSAVMREEASFGLSLPVPACNKNVVAPWESET